MKKIDEQWVALMAEAGQAVKPPAPERAEDLAANINLLNETVENAQGQLKFESEPSSFLSALQRHKDKWGGA